MPILFYIIIFILGLVLGSFLNCIIYRLKEDESVLKGRSYCPHCGHTLAIQDLIPLFSFLFLKGRCRYCERKISWQYPLVELAMGIGLVVIAFFGLGVIESVFYSILWALLLIIFVFDWRYMVVPDLITNAAIIITLGFSIWKTSLSGFWGVGSYLGNHLIAMLGAGLFFGFLHLITRKKGMGAGDIRIGLLMGLLLGIDKTIVALLISFVLGSIVGIILIAFSDRHMKSKVPFAPFLIFGTVVSLLGGQYLINWYLQLLL